MCDISSVYITGDKSAFLKPKSITNFKKNLKKLKKDDKLDTSLYLKTGYTYKFHMDNIDYHVEILTEVKYNEEKEIEKKKIQKDILRNKLRNRINKTQSLRSNEMMEKMRSLKRSIPKNIFESYKSLIQKFNFSIPSPDEVINDPDKFQEQISLIMGSQSPISNDNNADIKLKKYFKVLGDFLGIEPKKFETNNETKQEKLPTQLSRNNEDTEDEDTDEETPVLV